MDTTQTTHLSLCSGYGGIDLGLRRAIPNLRTVAYAEIEAFACENLLARMEGGQLDPAPIWPDLKSFPWGAFSDRVDILSGGYPCQPFSAAGKRLGTDDPRHLWPYIADGIRILRPRICFFENVEGHISLGLREVISELESMGYKVSWGIFSASECGAPHQRKRVFILAVAGSLGGAAGLSGSFPRHEGHSGELDDGGGEVMADAGHFLSWRRPESIGSKHADTSNGGQAVGQPVKSGMEGSYDNRQSSGRFQSDAVQSDIAWPSRPGEQQYGWEPPRVVADSHRLDRSAQAISLANARSVCGQRADTNGVCGREICESPRRSEVRSEDSGCGSPDGELGNAAEQGCGRLDDESSETSGREPRGHADWSSHSEQQEQWQTQPALGGDADGPAGGLDYAELSVSCDNRTDELRLIGNGVVPATATLAFQTLLAEFLTL